MTGEEFRLRWIIQKARYAYADGCRECHAANRMLAVLDDVEPLNCDNLKVHAPFTEGQVLRLGKFQRSGEFHPFTCCDHITMIPQVNGMHCPECGHIQNWVHAFMLLI